MLETNEGKRICIYMDLFKLPPSHDPAYPQGYKFSWIAFEEGHPQYRVLFDCHPRKGPHLHIDSDIEGIPFQWRSIDEARKLFCAEVVKRFGHIPDFKDVIE